MVVFALVGVGDGEVGDRLVEFVAAPDSRRYAPVRRTGDARRANVHPHSSAYCVMTLRVNNSTIVLIFISRSWRT